MMGEQSRSEPLCSDLMLHPSLLKNALSTETVFAALSVTFGDLECEEGPVGVRTDRSKSSVFGDPFKDEVIRFGDSLEVPFSGFQPSKEWNHFQNRRLSTSFAKPLVICCNLQLCNLFYMRELTRWLPT